MARNLNLGRRIKELREPLGLTKSDLARLTGVTPTAVWNWEENGIVPRSAVFSTLAATLKVSEGFLRSGSGDAETAPSTKTVAAIIEQARKDIAVCSGMSPNKVQVRVEFIGG